jgi:hypothetical protein
MKMQNVLTNLEFVGQAEGDKLTYYVFKGRSGYIVASAGSRGSYRFNLIDAEAPDAISKHFGGQQVTSKALTKGRRPDLFSENFDRLNSLYVMVALGRARKLKRRDGKSMVFKIKASG